MAFDISTAKPDTGGFDISTATPVSDASTVKEAQGNGRKLPATWSVDIPGYGPVIGSFNKAANAYLVPHKGGVAMIAKDKNTGGLMLSPVNAQRIEGLMSDQNVQGIANALQGVTLGFSDEMAGIGNAATEALKGNFDVAENYRKGRDFARGQVEGFKEKYPIMSQVEQGIASLPVTLGVQPFKAAQGAGAIKQMAVNMGNAGASGALYGGVNAAGASEATTPEGVAADTLKGAVTGGALAAGTVPVATAVGAVGRNVAQRFSPTAANEYAKQKVGEALIRDARGEVFQTGESSPIDQALARYYKLGPGAAVADVGGQNTKQLLDVTASLPGKTKDMTERFIRERQAGRAQRLSDAADQALGTKGRNYSLSLEMFNEARKKAAEPYYNALQGYQVPVDNKLKTLLQRAAPYQADADKLSIIETGAKAGLGEIQEGGYAKFKDLDILKQSLYDAADAAKRQNNKKLGASIDKLRQDLIAKLDDAAPKVKTPDGKGESVYKLARDAWAGPSELMGAAEAGRNVMKSDAISIADEMKGLSQSEMQAFRIGVLQSIKDKTGRQSGQTELLNMWKEPATSGKLKEVFGGDYKKFASAVAAEARLKGLESAGRGSQTFARQQAAQDLDVSAVADLGQAAATKNPLSILSAGGNLWNRVQTPEPVRDEIGRILLTKGQQTPAEIEQLRQSLEKVRQARAARAAKSGAFIGAQVAR